MTLLVVLSSEDLSAGGGSTLVTYGYAYDRQNHVINETFSDSPGSTVNSTFTYTPDRQLTTENDSGTYNSATYTYSLANNYDANGNQTGTGIIVSSNNELTEKSGNGYLYDNVGNRIQDADDLYTWDNRNRLSTDVDGFEGSGQDISYTYNPQNQRIEEKDQTSTSTVFTEFALDPGDHLTMELEQYRWPDFDLYLPDPTGSTSSPLAHEDASGNVAWLITDQNGSVAGRGHPMPALPLRSRVVQCVWKPPGEQRHRESLQLPGNDERPDCTVEHFCRWNMTMRWYDAATESFVKRRPQRIRGRRFRISSGSSITIRSTRLIRRE